MLPTMLVVALIAQTCPKPGYEPTIACEQLHACSAPPADQASQCNDSLARALTHARARVLASLQAVTRHATAAPSLEDFMAPRHADIWTPTEPDHPIGVALAAARVNSLIERDRDASPAQIDATAQASHLGALARAASDLARRFEVSQATCELWDRYSAEFAWSVSSQANARPGTPERAWLDAIRATYNEQATLIHSTAEHAAEQAMQVSDSGGVARSIATLTAIRAAPCARLSADLAREIAAWLDQHVEPEVADCTATEAHCSPVSLEQNICAALPNLREQIGRVATIRADGRRFGVIDLRELKDATDWQVSIENSIAGLKQAYRAEARRAFNPSVCRKYADAAR